MAAFSLIGAAVLGALGNAAVKSLKPEAPKPPKIAAAPVADPAADAKQAKLKADKKKANAIGAFGFNDTLLTPGGSLGVANAGAENKGYKSLLGT